MATQEEAFQVADQMLSEGLTPTYRTVNARLPKGNKSSPKVMLRYLDAWRDERGYKSSPELDDLPKLLRDRLDTFATDAWKAAQEGALRDLLRERESINEIRRAEAEERETLLGMIEISQTETASTKALLEAAKNEIIDLVARLESSEEYLVRVRALRYWDQVMAEVHSILPPDGSMTAREILPLIRDATIRGAALHKEELDVKTLRKKMKGRSDEENYFELVRPGYRFKRRATPKD
ncbi:DNA-binding protein [Methylobacterium sp. GC_Met_2]|uniref:DNA-binding protein n=1 Tax=Methylobacterium sp. GC_Met_2 TaxID=2937376 RepID=UPI00226BB684|nr:DNA-binding protein [Methylobacterium sp. GC_Met_2]